MKFTKEEISLCKQVAEKYKKEIKFGDWYLHQVDVKDFPQLCKFVQNENVLKSTNEYIIPLWTISDCLEFLRENGVEQITMFLHSHSIEMIIHNIKYTTKTPLEACLKAVLAMLRET